MLNSLLYIIGDDRSGIITFDEINGLARRFLKNFTGIIGIQLVPIMILLCGTQARRANDIGNRVISVRIRDRLRARLAGKILKTFSGDVMARRHGALLRALGSD